jgi:hypothetical protein
MGPFDMSNVRRFITPGMRHLNSVLGICDLTLTRRSTLACVADELQAELERKTADLDQAQQLWFAGTPGDQKAFLEFARYFQPVAVKNFNKIRVGRNSDGGYVMLDRFEGITTALSFGVEREASWDAAMARRGCSIFMFDHSVDGPPEENVRFHFFKRRVGAKTSESVESIESILRAHGAPGRANILKMDIEGSEWNVLDSTEASLLDRF